MSRDRKRALKLLEAASRRIKARFAPLGGCAIVGVLSVDASLAEATLVIDKVRDIQRSMAEKEKRAPIVVVLECLGRNARAGGATSPSENALIGAVLYLCLPWCSEIHFPGRAGVDMALKNLKPREGILPDVDWSLVEGSFYSGDKPLIPEGDPAEAAEKFSDGLKLVRVAHVFDALRRRHAEKVRRSR